MRNPASGWLHFVKPAKYLKFIAVNGYTLSPVEATITGERLGTGPRRADPGQRQRVRPTWWGRCCGGGLTSSRARPGSSHAVGAPPAARQDPTKPKRPRRCRAASPSARPSHLFAFLAFRL